MQQLFLFNDFPTHKKTPQSKQGRPNTITPKIVFDVVESLKSKKSNQYIISKFKISERTFFRIKKGEYDHLLKKYLDNELDNFSLDFNY
tara:strand:- start:204 stop:470 length:267 start_codon:yes stop_codon:yes gene_type:complete